MRHAFTPFGQSDEATASRRRRQRPRVLCSPGSYMCSGATLKLIGVNFVATARLCNTMAEKGENSEENVVDEDLVVKKNCTFCNLELFWIP